MDKRKGTFLITVAEGKLNNTLIDIPLLFKPAISLIFFCIYQVAKSENIAICRGRGHEYFDLWFFSSINTYYRPLIHAL
jgi:hypothetical protein